MILKEFVIYTTFIFTFVKKIVHHCNLILLFFAKRAPGLLEIHARVNVHYDLYYFGAGIFSMFC